MVWIQVPAARAGWRATQEGQRVGHNTAMPSRLQSRCFYEATQNPTIVVERRTWVIILKQ